MKNPVAIFGAGQLGSRYLQGLALSEKVSDVFVYDRQIESLKIAKVRLAEVERAGRMNVTYSSDLTDCPLNVALAIITTTADARANLVQQIAGTKSVKYWILEKVLGQSVVDLEVIERAVSVSAGAWVNTARRAAPWYQKISNDLDLSGSLQVMKTGFNWGLTCNGIHFVDLAQWWTGSPPVCVDTTGLSDWFPSKRPKFYEAHGVIQVQYGDGSSLILIDNKEHKKEPYIHVQTSTERWTIDETAGIAQSDSEKTVKGRLPFQSELTAPVVDEILTAGTCPLPTLKDSIVSHRPYLLALASSWNAGNDSEQTDQKRVPIT